VDYTWTEGNYNLPFSGYMSINTLNIYNDVTVKMYGGGEMNSKCMITVRLRSMEVVL
jgi:hypothetical protein